MNHNVPLVLALVLAMGIGAQWLAWRLALPSILLLLGLGILAGPATGFLDPDRLFGELLTPTVSLSVAVILLEGGLTLRFRELREAGRTVLRLVTIGALVTWILGALAATFVLGLPPALAILLGAILIVTGPTVIQPLLQHIKPAGAVDKILKWEGIVIDPIGALVAVLVFEAMLSGPAGGVTAHTLQALAKTIVLGGGLGLVAAGAFLFLAKRYWIPDHLQSALLLAFALVAFVGANRIQHESGLFTVTLLGVLLANQRSVGLEHVVEFKENLRVLLISTLFVVLGARLDLSDVAALGWRGGLFVAALILVVRPLAVLASTASSGLAWREKMFLAWMAPRGIVAAAVSSVFALQLEASGMPGAKSLVAATFAVIIGTVVVYGLTAPLLAFRTKIAERNPQGLLVVGADRWQRALAEALKKTGVRVLLVDTNRTNVQRARMAGLDCVQGNVLSEPFLENLTIGGIGRVLATTPNDLVNLLVVQRLSRLFGRANAYQLAPLGHANGTKDAPAEVEGRVLFSPQANWQVFDRRIATGGVFKTTRLSEEFDYAAFRERYGESVLPLFVLDEAKRLRILAAGDPPAMSPGQSLVALVDEKPEPASATTENSATAVR